MPGEFGGRKGRELDAGMGWFAGEEKREFCCGIQREKKKVSGGILFGLLVLSPMAKDSSRREEDEPFICWKLLARALWNSNSTGAALQLRRPAAGEMTGTDCLPEMVLREERSGELCR